MKKMREIEVNVNVQYLSDESSAKEQQFVWAYEITINNQSDLMVQLQNRYWCIIDMTSRIEEVKGPGVIGLQPIIRAGKQFTYTSYCQLTTPHGTMEGHYEVQDILHEENYLVAIPKFILSAPTSITQNYRSRMH